MEFKIGHFAEFFKVGLLFFIIFALAASLASAQVSLGDDWQFYGDSETDGRAYDTPSLVSQNEAFLTIYEGNFSTSGLNFFKHGVGGESLESSQSRYNDNSNHPNATWVHFQESGNQDKDGQRSASEYATTFENFVREIASESPGAVISTETAYSFEREDQNYRDWSQYNVAMKQKIAELQSDGINVYVAEVDSAIKVLVDNLGFNNVMTSDGGHFQGNGNFLVALMMFKALGYDLNSLSYSHISTSELSVDERTLCLQIAAGEVSDPDNTPPTAPGSLQGSAISPTRIDLSWQAATDNEGSVVRYKIYMNGNLFDSTASLNFTATGLSPETEYSFEVSAVDGEGLEGNRSSTLQVTTEANTDNTPPSVPGSLEGTAVGSTEINLSWQAATDNESSVVRYKIYMNGNLLDSTTSRSYTVTGLSPETEYSFEISAVNGAGLEGNHSSALQVTTEANTNPTDSPLAPDSLKGFMDPNGNIVLNWQDPNQSQNPLYRIIKNEEVLDSTRERQYSDVSNNIDQQLNYTVQCVNPEGTASQPSEPFLISTQVHDLDSAIILVNYGESEAGNNYGNDFFNKPIMDRYTGYYSEGSGSVGIKEGENKDYNFQGVSGEYLNLEAGQYIYAYWFNNTDSSIQFTPRFSSTDFDRPVSGDSGVWHPMSETSLDAGKYGFSVFEITEQEAGYYNLININANYSSGGGLLLSAIGWSKSSEISSVSGIKPLKPSFSYSNRTWVFTSNQLHSINLESAGVYNSKGNKVGNFEKISGNSWKISLTQQISQPLFYQLGEYRGTLPSLIYY